MDTYFIKKCKTPNYYMKPLKNVITKERNFLKFRGSGNRFIITQQLLPTNIAMNKSYRTNS